MFAMKSNVLLFAVTRRSFATAMVCAFAFAVAGVFVTTPAAHAEDVRIGAIASLTGQAGEQGKNWLNGVRLAEEELKKQGVPVVLTVEDDASTPAKSVSAFRKLHDFNHVEIVLGGTWDFLAEALVPLITSAKIPFITMTNPIEILSKEAQASAYVFTNALSLQATEVAMKKFLDEQKPRSVAILTPSFPFTTAHAALAEKLSQDRGIKVAFSKTFSYDDYFQTIKVLATKVVRSKADLVFIFVSSQALDPFITTLKQQGGSPTILTSQHLDAAFAMTSDKSAYKKTYAVYPKVVDSDFSRRYRERFHEEPRVYSAEGYDAMMFAALSKAAKAELVGGTTPFEYKGATGEYTLPVQNHQLGKISAQIMTTRQGKFEPAPEFDTPAN